MRIILAITAILYSFSSFAAQPICNTHASGNYCTYTGIVSKVYVNSSNMILMYFEQPVDINTANSFGMNIVHGEAAAFLIDNNPEFAKLSYSTILAAQASNRPNYYTDARKL